jgi:hypothetical protein
MAYGDFVGLYDSVFSGVLLHPSALANCLPMVDLGSRGRRALHCLERNHAEGFPFEL